jgi:hypothetical protein
VIVLALRVARDDAEPRRRYGRPPPVVVQSAADEGESPFEAPGGVGASLGRARHPRHFPVVAPREPLLQAFVRFGNLRRREADLVETDGLRLLGNRLPEPVNSHGVMGS